MRSSRPSGPGGAKATPTCPGSSTTATADRNTARCGSANDSSRPASHPRSAPSGDSFDNALAETINGLYKTELIKRGKPWRTVEEVELATAEWIDWFNHRRLYEYCGDIPPVELETAHYAQQPAQQTAALSHQ